METKGFIWTPKLSTKMFRLRFENEHLFQKKKQPWTEFHKILMDNGFPEEMTVDHVRKKWSYTWDSYKIAKKTRNKKWKYYKLFDKHFGKNKVLDKYDSWTDEWRCKLITCIIEALEYKDDHRVMWRMIEKSLRCQDLPDNCCIQDIKGLWHHLETTFSRRHRIALKKTEDSERSWSLYYTMLDYYQKYDPDTLIKLDAESSNHFVVIKKKSSKNSEKNEEDDNKPEFQWSKDITESFIQIRLQNDWLFREQPQPWKHFLKILKEEHGFPDNLSQREICRKWATIYGEYQKSKATNNNLWVYYNLFQLYSGEELLSLNPLTDWKEEWVLNFINARTDLEYVFGNQCKDPNNGWREVEKRLRTIGLPLTHSLLDLPEMWSYLLKMYRWKQKFAVKGILTERWPYYEAMAHYEEMHRKEKIKLENVRFEVDDYDAVNDDYEDNMKLFDLKHKIESLRPKDEVGRCRACANVEALTHCVDLYEYRDGDGTDLASKLKVVAGVEVDKSDSLTSQICNTCLQELENAYKFRRKCQNADQMLREIRTRDLLNVKTEITDTAFDDNIENDDLDLLNGTTIKTGASSFPKLIKQERKKKVRQKKYEYWKVCEICGKNTKNLPNHMDMHSDSKQYSCDICDKKFKFKAGLNLHKGVHEDKPCKTCEICGKTFYIMAHYKKHFVHHANERKYECETCGKRFNTSDILRVHNRMHTDERPFSCSDCGKTFRTAGCVSRHKRIVHRTVKKIE